MCKCAYRKALAVLLEAGGLAAVAAREVRLGVRRRVGGHTRPIQWYGGGSGSRVVLAVVRVR